MVYRLRWRGCVLCWCELYVDPCSLFTAFLLLSPPLLDALDSVVSCHKLQAQLHGYKENQNPISLDPRQLHPYTLPAWRHFKDTSQGWPWDLCPFLSDVYLGPGRSQKLNQAGSCDVDAFSTGAHTVVAFVWCAICRTELLPENSSGEWSFSSPHPVGSWR